MKMTLLLFSLLFGLLVSSKAAEAQEDCDQLCGAIIVNGVPIGFGCTGGGDRSRTNCRATVEDCTTDPCGGFALLSSTGMLLQLGTCQDRARYRAEAGALRKRSVNVFTSSEAFRQEGSLSTMTSSTAGGS